MQLTFIELLREVVVELGRSCKASRGLRIVDLDGLRSAWGHFERRTILLAGVEVFIFVGFELTGKAFHALAHVVVVVHEAVDL